MIETILSRCRQLASPSWTTRDGSSWGGAATIGRGVYPVVDSSLESRSPTALVVNASRSWAAKWSSTASSPCHTHVGVYLCVVHTTIMPHRPPALHDTPRESWMPNNSQAGAEHQIQSEITHVSDCAGSAGIALLT